MDPRECIDLLIKKGWSYAEIGQSIGLNRSSVWRLHKKIHQSTSSDAYIKLLELYKKEKEGGFS